MSSGARRKSRQGEEFGTGARHGAGVRGRGMAREFGGAARSVGASADAERATF
ncbi:MAG: hypothetical protein FWD58_05595 [Firmicutes bacterium]|nr:hypothetical protein [Bacillota bacterium]